MVAGWGVMEGKREEGGKVKERRKGGERGNDREGGESQTVTHYLT